MTTKTKELELYELLKGEARKLANMKKGNGLEHKLIGNVLAVVKIMTEEKLLDLENILIAADARVKELGYDKE